MNPIALIIGWLVLIVFCIFVSLLGMCLVKWAASDAKWRTERERMIRTSAEKECYKGPPKAGSFFKGDQDDN